MTITEFRPACPRLSRRCLPDRRPWAGRLAENRSRCEHCRKWLDRVPILRPSSKSSKNAPDFSFERRRSREALAGRRARRSRARAARRPGRGRRRDPRPETYPQGPRRFQAADRRSQREELFDDHPEARRSPSSFASGSAETHRPHRHPQGEPRGDAPRRLRPAAAPRLALADGRDVPPGLALRGPGGGQGRPALAVDRRRLDRRQGDARPDDGDAAARCHIGYGFDVHMGYATERHRAAIELARRPCRGCTA